MGFQNRIYFVVPGVQSHIEFRNRFSVKCICDFVDMLSALVTYGGFLTYVTEMVEVNCSSFDHTTQIVLIAFVVQVPFSFPTC